MPAGRPTVFTVDVLHKLEEAYAFGASDKEACFYANVAPSALYGYQERNPEFVERKEALKQRPILAARKKVIEDIEQDVVTAKWYLERKMNKEFATRTKDEHSGEQKLIIEKRGYSE